MSQEIKSLFYGRSFAVIVAILVAAALLAFGAKDELPVASVTGVATMTEDGKPLPNATVILRPTFVIPDRKYQSFVKKAKEDGSFSFSNIPAGDYTVEAMAKAHTMAETKLAIKEGKSEIPVSLKPNDPYLGLYDSQHVFLPNEEPQFVFDGFVKADAIDVTTYKINFTEIVRGGGLEQVIWSVGRWNKDVSTMDKGVFVPISNESLPITKRDVEGTFRETMNFKKLPKGFYWLSAKAGSTKAGAWLMVTDIALITKSSHGKVLAFVTDLKSGKALAGATVSVPQNGVNQVVGKTDANGTCSFTLPGSRNQERISVSAQLGDSQAVVSLYAPSEMDAEKNLRAYLYTDRPVYRPGDTIEYKGIVRKLVGNGLAVPPPGVGTIQVTDPDGALISNSTFQSNNFGSFSGKFSVGKEALTGEYEIQVRIGDEEISEYVTISSYRKPEFTVDVKSDRPYFVRGDKTTATVHSEYYFGGPVVGAKVTADIYKRPDWGSFDSSSGMFGQGEDYGSGSGEYVDSLTGVTDDSGNVVFDIDTSGIDPDTSSDWVYSIEASVEDAGGKFYDGAGTVLVSRGEFSMWVETDRWVVDIGKSVSFQANLASIGDNKPIRNATVTFTAFLEIWNDEKQEFDRRQLDTKVSQSDSDGIAEYSLAPNAEGSLVVEAHAKDSRGNSITSSQYIYVSGSGEQYYGSEGNVSIKLDKPRYDVGEKGKAVLMCKDIGGSALVTIEAGDVYDTQVVALKSKTTIIPFTVTAEHSPNAYITVAFVNDKRYFSSQADLQIIPNAQTINIEIKPDRAEVRPGQSVTYNIQAKDKAGRPVEADCSLSVVDESIYAIREDSTDLYSAFYPLRYNRVNTSYSFPEIYLGSDDKGDVSLDMRKKFLDTADWKPFVHVGPSGSAQVTVKLPDNLTSWRATVNGITADSRVGQGKCNVVVNKPLMIRPQFPRFVTQGDTIRVGAVIHNNSKQDTQAEITVRTEGPGINSTERKTLNLPADSPQSYEWEFSPTSPGRIKFTITAAADNGEGDGVEQFLVVNPKAEKQVEFHSGDTRSSKSISFDLSESAVREIGGLKLTLSPMIAASLFDSLEYLIGYPYGCVEQTTSRFIPTVIVSHILKKLNMNRPELNSEIPKMVKDGFDRLRKMQHSDGGWGWWEYDESDAWMTATVLDGYCRAADAGFVPDQSSWERGEKWALEYLNSEANAISNVKLFNKDFWETEKVDGRLFLMLALAKSGRSEEVKKSLAGFDPKWAASSGQLALLMETQFILGDSSGTTNSLRRLESLAVVEGDTASWAESWWGVETTARVIGAIAKVNPSHSLLPKAIRWLLKNRRGGEWVSTRDTAVALYGISEYVLRTGEATGNYQLQVLLNGKRISEYTFSPTSFDSKESQITIPASELKPGSNQVELKMNGTGVLYYSGTLTQFVSADQLEPTSSQKNFTIDRTLFALVSRRDSDGNLRLLTSSNPIGSAKAGEIIRCVVNFSNAQPTSCVMVEVPIPAGCEITERLEPDDPTAWEYWYSGIDIRDDKMVFFARSVSSGTHTLSFNMRAESVGKFVVMPAIVSNMYDPEKSASSGQSNFEVSR